MKRCMIVAAVLAAVLIGFTGCPNPAQKVPEPTQYSVIFAHDDNGTLGATVDGTAITSGNRIAVGSTVEFTAKPNAGYIVEKWKITGGAIEAGTGKDGSDRAKIKVTSEVTVRVSFKTATPGKHAVSFTTADTHGTLTAKVTAGDAIDSGNEVENGKTVEFIAEPKANYTATWTVTGGAFEAGTGTYGSTMAKVKVTSDVTVKVSFLKLHKVDATLSVYAPLMKLDLAKGQPDKGEKFKPIVEGCHVTVDGEGKVMLTVRFRKSYVTVFGVESNTFVDPRNSHPGYYDMDGVKQDAPYTVSTDDTADDPDGKKVHYVTSMTFPVSKDKEKYFLWLYLNSGVMGAQSGDGKGDAGPGEPNKHSKYEGKFTVDWSTLTEE